MYEVLALYEVRSSCIVGGARVERRREYQHFLGGIGQGSVQISFSFSDHRFMLFTKHWKEIPNKLFSKKKLELIPKKFAPNFVENDWA